MPKKYLYIAVLSLCCIAPIAASAAESENQRYQLNIESQPLLPALRLLSDETGLEVLFFSEVADGVRSAAVAGRYSQDEALETMLAGSGLEPVDVGEDGAVGIRLKGATNLLGKGQPVSRQTLIAQSTTPTTSSKRAISNAGSANGRDGQRSHRAGIEEVIVTAQKRATSLQDTALTITAFSGDDLAKSGVANTMDLQLHTPGLVMSSNGGWGLPYLRGVGTDIIGPGVDSGVAIYVDGVYQARNAGKVQQLLDVERVEVLKGPQGILYGRNAIGGAINIISKAPSDEFTGNIGIDLGNFNQAGIRGSVSGPLIDKKLLGRLSFSNTDNDGYTKDLLSGDRYQFTDTTGLRGSLAFSLTDKLEARINASWSNTESAFAYTPINPDTNPLFTLNGATMTGDPRKVLNDHPNQQQTEEWGLSARLNWDLSEFIMTSITAFNNSDYKLICDLDGTEVSLFTCGSPSFSDEPYSEKSDFFSQEFVLTSQNQGRLEWTALLYYMREDASLFGRNDLPLFGLITRSFADAETEAAAAAGQLSYALTDQLSLTGGIRVSHEEKSFENSSTSNGLPVDSADDKDSWTVSTPKIVIQYSPTEDIMAYVSATRGFKSGGFNTFEIQDSFDQETLWSYEAGLRSTLLEQRLRANLTVFHYDYKDLQINQWRITEDRVNGFGLVENAGEAAVNGAELELLATPSKNLQVEVGIAWLDAEFDDFISLDPDRTEEGILDRAGNALPRAPDFTASIAAEYAVPIGRAGDLTLRGEYFYRDQMFFTPYEDDRVSVEAINITNARLAFASADGHWNAALYGKNLSDEDYAQYIITVQGLIGQIAVFAPPRTYGIQIGYNF